MELLNLEKRPGEPEEGSLQQQIQNIPDGQLWRFWEEKGVDQNALALARKNFGDTQIKDDIKSIEEWLDREIQKINEEIYYLNRPGPVHFTFFSVISMIAFMTLIVLPIGLYNSFLGIAIMLLFGGSIFVITYSRGTRDFKKIEKLHSDLLDLKNLRSRIG